VYSLVSNGTGSTSVQMKINYENSYRWLYLVIAKICLKFRCKIYQNEDGTDVSPRNFPKRARLEAKHSLDVVGESLRSVAPTHAHCFDENEEQDCDARTIDVQ